jgi:hypothetical protein
VKARKTKKRVYATVAKTSKPAAPKLVTGSKAEVDAFHAHRAAARDVLRGDLDAIHEGAKRIDQWLLSIITDLSGNHEYADTCFELAQVVKENFMIRLATRDEKGEVQP